MFLAILAGGRRDSRESPEKWSAALRSAANEAGVPWAGLHTLRHTCATILFKRGLNAKQVQVWLGHHSPAFTLATYVHLLSDDLPQVDFLDEVAAPRGDGDVVKKGAEAERRPSRVSAASPRPRR